MRLLAVLLLFGVATPALADRAKEDAHARKVMHDYARCVVKAQPKRAAEAIIADVSNSVIMKHYSDLISSECMGQTGGDVQMTFSGDMYRYALADALVNANFATKGENDFSNRLPLAHLRAPSQTELEAELAKASSKRKRAEIEQQYSKDAAVEWLSRYGECVVRADPVRSRLWLLTPPDGPEEMSRINDLRSSFSDCLSGGTLKFSRVNMRGTVAINYFRLANATPQHTAEKAQ